MTMIWGNNIGQNAESVLTIPPEAYDNMIKGSKMGFATWFTYMTFVWCLKAAVLGLCHRIAYAIITIFSYILRLTFYQFRSTQGSEDRQGCGRHLCHCLRRMYVGSSTPVPSGQEDMADQPLPGRRMHASECQLLYHRNTQQLVCGPDLYQKHRLLSANVNS